MDSNKIPGNYSLSKEFHICFFDEIITHLLAFVKGQLSNSQRQEMTTLIEKKVKTKDI